MKIAFFLSTAGGSPLQAGLERGFRQLGHEIEYYRTEGWYDLILIFNQAAHTIHYAYPDFPRQGCPMAFIDCAEYGYYRRLPSVIRDYYNTFQPGAMNHDTKNLHEQTRLKNYLEGKHFPYFLREYSKYVNYPPTYYPIDYPLYIHSECHQPPDRDEYLSRELELFVSWGGSHPWRMQITEALRNCHRKAEIYVIGENGTPRMPQGEYFARTRAARASVSFDGYGSSSFRLTEVLVRTMLLVGPLSIVRHAPLADGTHCVEYDIQHNDTEFISTNICEKLTQFLQDPERCFRIYDAGYYHCMDYYTEKATAQYVLDTIQRHNWSHPTPLTF